MVLMANPHFTGYEEGPDISPYNAGWVKKRRQWGRGLPRRLRALCTARTNGWRGGAINTLASIGWTRARF